MSPVRPRLLLLRLGRSWPISASGPARLGLMMAVQKVGERSEFGGRGDDRYSARVPARCGWVPSASPHPSASYAAERGNDRQRSARHRPRRRCNGSHPGCHSHRARVGSASVASAPSGCRQPVPALRAVRPRAIVGGVALQLVPASLERRRWRAMARRCVATLASTNPGDSRTRTTSRRRPT